MLITSNADFPITNKRYWAEFTICLTLWHRGTYPVPPICHHLPQIYRLIVVDANERGTSLLQKSKVFKPVDNVPVYGVCLLLHG